MATLFAVLVTLLVICILVLVLVDRHVKRSADSWEAIDRWLLVGSFAAPSAYILAGGVVGVGLAWVIV